MMRNWRRNPRAPWNLGKAAGDLDIYRRYISCYMAQVTEVDHYIGTILAGLDAAGARENTVVIYASDHGDFVAAHGMVEKCAVGQNVYEDTLRVPMIVSWPKRFRRGAVTDDLVELVDIYPTLAELLGLERSGGAFPLAGRSLVPALERGRAAGRSAGSTRYPRTGRRRPSSPTAISSVHGSSPRPSTPTASATGAASSRTCSSTASAIPARSRTSPGRQSTRGSRNACAGCSMSGPRGRRLKASASSSAVGPSGSRRSSASGRPDSPPTLPEHVRLDLEGEGARDVDAIQVAVCPALALEHVAVKRPAAG